MIDLTVEHLSFAYSHHNTILEDVNFSLKEGFNTIIGPNGTGKTTLMRLMNGLLKPSKGHVYINEQSVHGLSSIDKARIFTTIHQQVDIKFPYTVMEMVSHGRYAKTKDMNRLTNEDYSIMVQAMEETDCLQYKDALMTELSGGEKQRVMLATALAQEPKILFIDEGFSALDIRYKAEMIKLLKNRIATSELMVISIIHDLNLAYSISDEVLILNKGKIEAIGKPEKVMDLNVIESVYHVQLNTRPERSFQIMI